MSKRFVTYRTEDQKAGLVNVDENGVMKQGGGSGLPSGGEPFKQLVTDADGKTVWEDRLAYRYGDDSITWDGSTEGRTTFLYPVTESENLTFYKVSDTFWDTDKLIGAYVTVNSDEELGLPQTFEITSDIIQTNYEAARVIIQVLPSSSFPFILSISDGYDEYEQGVYVLLVKAEEIQSSFHIPAEKDLFAKEIATAPIVSTIPKEYLPKMMTVVIDMDDNDNYIASATYDEIEKEILSGRTVVCKYGVYLFHLMHSSTISDISTMVALPSHVFANVSTNSVCSVSFIEINSNNAVSMNTVKLTVAT